MRMLVLVIAAALLLAACGGRSAQQPAAPSSPAAQPPQPAGVQEVAIKMSEFKFEPTTMEVRAGTVKFEMENAGTVEHNFIIVGTTSRLEAIQPGKAGELEATLQAGTYQIECDVPGHKEAGMTMTLVVK